MLLGCLPFNALAIGFLSQMAWLTFKRVNGKSNPSCQIVRILLIVCIRYCNSDYALAGMLNQHKDQPYIA
jgi:hypothetical protein